MKGVKAEHPAPALLAAFGQGQLSEAEQAAVADHVAGCSTCCEALRGVPNDTLMERLRNRDTDVRPLDAAAATAPKSFTAPPELENHSRYRLVRVLGHGGMGTVWLAEHRMMERLVALKIISREFTSNAMAVDRFRQEVRVAGKLSHPNIVAAHDAEQAGELHFLVMEYVDGTSLARVVEKKGPLPVVNACNYIRQAALGLQHANDKGMVHRDIKPQNLMLTRKGQVKILDFGLARFAQAHGAAETQAGLASALPSRAGLTAAGMVVGTPDYIAPEQVNDSRHVDVRADIYSLGCTLYFLLTGRTPFPDGTPLDKALSHCDRTPQSVTELRPGLPPDAVKIIERMMAKKPAERYQTPAELAQALAPLAKGGDATLPMVIVAEPLPPAPTEIEPLAANVLKATTELRRPARKRLRPKPKAGDWRRSPVAWIVGIGLVGLLLIGALIGIRSVFFNNTDEGKTDLTRREPVASSPKELLRPASGPAAASGRDTAPPAARTSGKKRVLLVIPFTDFWYPDYVQVSRGLRLFGVDVEVASSRSGLAQPDRGNGGWGEPVEVDKTLDSVNPADFDAVVFSGGRGVLAEYTRDQPYRPAAKRLIDAMLAQKKPVTAICGGPVVLADADVLRGKSATCYHDQRFRSILTANGATISDEHVVEDGLIITCDSPPNAKPFVLAILDRLGVPHHK